MIGSLTVESLKNLRMNPKRIPGSYRPFGNIGFADLSGLSGPSSLGDVDPKMLSDHYWNVRNRGFEIAQKCMDLAEQYAQIQQIKHDGIDGVKRQIAKSVPIPPSGGGMFGSMVSMAQYAVQIGSIFTKYLKPAVEELNLSFSDAENELKDGAALLGWLDGKWRMNVLPTMESIRKELKVGDYVEALANAIRQRAGRETTDIPRSAESWVLDSITVAQQYAMRIAPDFAKAYSDSIRVNAMGVRIVESIDRVALSQEHGIPIADVDAALRSMGLGLTGLEIAAVILIIALLAGTAGAAIYYNMKATAIAQTADKGVQEFAKKVNEDVLEGLKAEAQRQVDLVAAETDPTKREDARKQANASIELKAAESKAAVTKMADDLRAKINSAKPGLFDFSELLLPIGIAVGAILLISFIPKR
jgi:hypothetical protein